MSGYYDEEYEEERREMRTGIDFFIESDAVCGVCKIQNNLDRPLRQVCSECGEATHTECGADTEPSGGWDRDPDINYWVCNTCLAVNAEGVDQMGTTEVTEIIDIL